MCAASTVATVYPFVWSKIDDFARKSEIGWRFDYWPCRGSLGEAGTAGIGKVFGPGDFLINLNY